MEDQKNKSTSVFLDLEVPGEAELNDEITGLNALGIFLGQKEDIGKRVKEIKSSGIFYPSRSVTLFQQAKKLYVLGLYESSIMVCRSTVEYIANELFEEEMSGFKDEKLSGFIVDSIDFRKLVNDFLFPKIIDKNSRKKFNDIYDLGNRYIHPKKIQINAHDDAKNVITLLCDLILSLRNLLDKYEIVDGILKKK
ncbi:MAG: DUF4145 domain-containing protein [Candidatus Uhrbacteria bacterium]